MYDKEVFCNVCNKDFISKKVRVSRLKVEKRDSDFLNRYKKMQPLKYNVFVCPTCGYTNLERKFEDIKDSQIKIIKDKISSRWKGKNYGGKRSLKDGVEVYKLALINAKILSYTKFEIGYICLNIAWLYRLRGDDEEIRFLKLAKNNFKQAYYKEDISSIGMDEAKLTYLIGELSRRTEDIKEAMEWYSLALKSEDIDKDPNLKNLIQEQWQLIREV